MIHHLRSSLLNKNLFGDLYIYLNKSSFNGNKSVEFFFIISGFFLIYGFNKNLSTFDFIKKKIIRLSPLMLFFNIIYLILSLFTKSIKYDTYNNILSLLFLGNIGVTKSHGNLRIFWYVSVLFWVSFLYFYLLKYFERKNINLFSAISIWFSYVFMIQARNGNISDILKTYNNIFVVGLLRGLGGMGIGYFIGSIYKENEDKIENMEFKK